MFLKFFQRKKKGDRQGKETTDHQPIGRSRKMDKPVASIEPMDRSNSAADERTEKQTDGPMWRDRERERVEN